jgi:hypothetical protein
MLPSTELKIALGMYSARDENITLPAELKLLIREASVYYWKNLNTLAGGTCIMENIPPPPTILREGGTSANAI